MSVSVIRAAEPHCGGGCGRFRMYRPGRLTLFLLLSLAVHTLLLLLLPQRGLSLPRLAPRPGGLAALSARLMPAHKAPAPRPHRTGTAPATPPPPALLVRGIPARPARRRPVLAQKGQAAALRVAVASMAPERARGPHREKAKPAAPARAFSRNHAATQRATLVEKTTTAQADAPAFPSHRLPQPDGAAVRAVIARALHARFSYPYLARRNGWQGEVDLGLRVEDNGRVAHIRIIKSSGFGILDRAALASAGHIQSLSGLVHLLYGHAIDLVLPVQYRLSDS